ncbi:hypothetical protein D3C85_1260750 [compost metagenome]
MQVGVLRRGGGDVGRGRGDQQRLAVTGRLATATVADRRLGVARIAQLPCGAGHTFCCAAIVQLSVGVQLFEAVDATLHRQGIVLPSGLGQ